MTTRAELIDAIDLRLQALERRHPGVLAEQLGRSASLTSLVDHLTGPLLRRVLQGEMTRDLGPFYDTAGLMRRWKVSKQAVSKRHRSGALLALTTDDGRLLYPTWQFAPGSEDHPVPLEGLAEVRSILAERNRDPLSHAIWLTAPIFGPTHDPLPAFRVLADPRGRELVRSAARAEMTRLAEGASSG